MGAWVHRLLEIDEDEKLGTCANCGPNIPIRKKQNGWRCALSERRWDGGKRRAATRQLCPHCGQQMPDKEKARPTKVKQAS